MAKKMEAFMKGKIKFFGIAAVVAMIVFSIGGCDLFGDDGKGHILNGVWDRGDIIITFNGSNGIYTEINSDSGWLQFLNNGVIRIGDRKFRNITYKDNLRWSGQEMTRESSPPPYNIYWRNTTITMSYDEHSIQVVTVVNEDTKATETATYVRK